MLQKIIDVVYRHPRSALKNYERFGGYLSYREMLNGKSQMQAAASRLPPVYSASGGLPVYFLTGKKYLYQTLFCIQSLQKLGVDDLEYHLVDDGSFNPAIIAGLQKQLPGAVIHTAAEVNIQLQRVLPPARFPAIHQKRSIYPHLKKLTDIHSLTGNDWKLVMDSDMLFWQAPAELMVWLSAPARPIYLQDCIRSYGYSANLMQSLCNNTIAERVNVGIVGLSSSSINWPDIEQWIIRLEAEQGTSYYLEQALTAMLIGNTVCEVLPASQYIVNPSDVNIAMQGGVLHHYVDLSKKGYFKTAWKNLT